MKFSSKLIILLIVIAVIIIALVVIDTNNTVTSSSSSRSSSSNSNSISSISSSSSGSSSSSSSSSSSYNENLERVKQCLYSGGQYRHYISSTDVPSHYYNILTFTKQYRSLYDDSNTHVGSLIEKMFIDTFINYNLSDFGGMLPLFIPWTDYTKKMNKLTENQIELFRPLLKLIRHDVIYVTVSQSNVGLEFLARRYPNILLINSGGVGHIPIPLIKGLIPIQPTESNFPKYNLSFFGSSYHGRNRKRIIDCIQKRVSSSSNNNIVMGFLKNWKIETAQSALSLAPEGFGRGTFRLTEIIQMGRVPVIAYADIPWIPYQGSNISVESIGLIIPSSDHGAKILISFLETLTIQRLFELMERVKEARYYYTTEGVLEQLKLFFSNPFGPVGGALSCTRTPDWGNNRIRKMIYLLGEMQQNVG